MIHRRFSAIILFLLAPVALCADDPKPTYPPPTDGSRRVPQAARSAGRAARREDGGNEDGERPHDGASQLRVGEERRRHDGARAGPGGAAGEGDRKAAGGDRPARHRRQQGGRARLADRFGQAGHHRRRHRRPLSRRALRRRQGFGGLRRCHHAGLGNQAGRADGASVLLRHLLGRLADHRLPAAARRRGRRAHRHDRHRAWAASKPGWRRRWTSASRCWCRRSACRAFAGAWTTIKWQGRANTIKGAHEAAAKDLGEAKVNQKVCRVLWSKVIPGILDQFDCPSMLRLFAGRPLLILNGEKDPNCPLEGREIGLRLRRSRVQGGEGRRQAQDHRRRGRRARRHRTTSTRRRWIGSRNG